MLKRIKHFIKDVFLIDIVYGIIMGIIFFVVGVVFLTPIVFGLKIYIDWMLRIFN